MLRFNRWVEECIDLLEHSAYATEYDKILVAWAQVVRICEEITSSFGYDGDVVSLSDSRAQLMVKSFETRLQIWNRDIGHRLKTGTTCHLSHSIAC